VRKVSASHPDSGPRHEAGFTRVVAQRNQRVGSRLRAERDSLPRSERGFKGVRHSTPLLNDGEMREWLNRRDWKSRVGVTPLPRVRIPLSPPACSASTVSVPRSRARPRLPGLRLLPQAAISVNRCPSRQRRGGGCSTRKGQAHPGGSPHSTHAGFLRRPDRERCSLASPCGTRSCRDPQLALRRGQRLLGPARSPDHSWGA